MTTPTPDEICERLRELLAQATARPWTAFDESGVRAIMKGKRPPSDDSGYPSRRWQEIVAWTGFDASDVAMRYRSPNLHLIVEAVNALSGLLDLIQQQLATIERLSAALEAAPDFVQRAFVAGFLAHMRNERADPFNEWEASEIRKESAALWRDASDE